MRPSCKCCTKMRWPLALNLSQSHSYVIAKSPVVATVLLNTFIFCVLRDPLIRLLFSHPLEVSDSVFLGLFLGLDLPLELSVLDSTENPRKFRARLKSHREKVVSS